MLDVIRIFLSTRGLHKWLVLASLVFASIAEGFGIATLLPALSLVFEGQASTDSVVHELIGRALQVLRLPMSFGVLLLLVATGILLKATLLLFAMRLVTRAVADFAADLRISLVKSLLDVKWSYFTRQPMGRFTNAAGVDATLSGDAYFLAANFLSQVFQTVIYIALAIVISWRVALVGIGFGMLTTLLLGPLVGLARRAGRKQQKTTAELVTLLSDTLLNIKPLKAMSRQDHFARFFAQRTQALRRALRREAFSRQSMRVLREPLFATFALTGFYLVQTHFAIAVAELIVMVVILERVVTKLARLQELLQHALVRRASFQAIETLLAEAHAEHECVSGSRKPLLDQGCALERVSFAFGERQVLDDVSMLIPAGQLTVITGLSGAGKTTIADLLLGFFEPASGRVLIDQTPLSEIDMPAWRRMVGYVPQELTLFHDTIQANVSLGDPSIGTEQVANALKTAGAWNFVSALPDGLNTTVGERGAQLSGGQRQRVALARALVFDPKLLILDEVTSALDPSTEMEICQNIKGLSKDLTILAITHRPLWIDIADRIYELDSHRARLVHETHPARQDAAPSAPIEQTG